MVVNSSQFRLAVLGGGAVVTELYLPSLTLMPDVEIVAVVDPSVATAERLQRAAFSGLRLAVPYNDSWDLLAKIPGGPPDAVIVALPNHLHEAATIASLERGYDVLVEKPLALTREACRRIGEAERRTGRVVAVGMVRRLHASVTALRRALDEGLAGNLTAVEVDDGAYYPWLSDSGAFFSPENGGILADMGVHYLDLLTDLFGALLPVSYVDDWCGGVEANVKYTLQTRAGVPVQLTLSRDRTLRNELKFIGTRGTLTLVKNDFATCHWSSSEAPGLRGSLDAVDPFADSQWPPDFLSGFAQQFFDFREVVKRNRTPRCTVESAAQVIGLLEDAYKVRDRRQAAVFGHLAEDAGGPRLAEGQITVTGGTGFIGSRLVARAAALGIDSIVAPVRGYMRCVELARFGATMPRMDLLDAQQARNAVRGSRFVFHLAYGRDGADARDATILGTKNIVEAAIAERCEAIVVLSTMYVFGRPECDGFVDESFPYRPIGGNYGKWKMEMEKWCLARAVGSSGTRIVVLNPSCVWGVQGKTYTRMPIDLAQSNRFCWIEDGRGIANHTYVENLIDAIILAATQPSAHGHRFIINDGTMQWRDFLTPLLGSWANGLKSYTTSELIEMARLKGTVKDVVRAVMLADPVRKAVTNHPILSRIARSAMKRSQSIESVVNQPRDALAGAMIRHAVPPDWLADLFSPDQVRFSAARAASQLKWVPRFDFATGVAHTVKWLSEVGAYSAVGRG